MDALAVRPCPSFPLVLPAAQPRGALLTAAPRLRSPPPRSAPHYQLYALFDGHRGGEAAQLCADAAVEAVEACLPPLPVGGPGAAAPAGAACTATALPDEDPEWQGALQSALLRAVVELQLRLGATAAGGGCTAAVALQVGPWGAARTAAALRAALRCPSGQQGLHAPPMCRARL